MKIIYFDCFSGISGDMCLAALLDLGMPLECLQEAVECLGIPVAVEEKTVHKGAIRAKGITVRELRPQPPARSLSAMLEIVAKSSLPEEIKAKTEACLRRLAAAEAAVHGTPPEKVHFHEVGGLDTLVDLAGTFIGIAHLKVEHLYASPLPLARGSIKTAHGLIPLPAPAALELLSGVPTYGVNLEAELVTPTGAALVTALASSFGPPPPAVWERVGYGAGSSDLEWPNVLRAWLGEERMSDRRAEKGAGAFEEGRVLVLETQVDDTNPEFLPHLRSRLEEAGAVDVSFIPLLMKKGRPGFLVTVLSPAERLYALARIIFQETSSLGLRWRQEGRIMLFRTTVGVETPYGRIPVKIGYALAPDGSREVFNRAPEYEDCARAAREHGVGIKEVYRSALAASVKIEDAQEI